MTDGLCAVHASVVSGTCARCGVFLCVACERHTALAGHCALCARILSPQARQVERAQRWARHALFVTSFGTVTLLVAVALLLADMHPTSYVPFALLLLGLSALLAAPALGAGTLIARRGTNAPQIVGRAALAIGMGVVALSFALILALWASGFDP